MHRTGRENLLHLVFMSMVVVTMAMSVAMTVTRPWSPPLSSHTLARLTSRPTTAIGIASPK